LGLANLLMLPLVGLNQKLTVKEIGIYLGGLIPALVGGILILLKLRQLYGQRLDLNGFKGWIQSRPLIGFLFLLCALGLTGFPVSTTFLGEDLLLSHIAEGDYGRAFLLSITFVLNGIAVIRLYARLFLGHYSKSMQHSTPLTI